MTDRETLLRVLFAFGLVAAAALMIFARLLAVDLTPGRFPGPDLFLALTFAWVLRRPEYIATVLVAALFFMMDMLLLRTPGIWTLMVVIGVEFLRRHEYGMRSQPFFIEWGVVSGVLLAMLISQRFVLAIFLVEQPPLGRALIEQISTAICYPLVVLMSGVIFGISKHQPGNEKTARRMA
jgi:rod shape-determining protein MreD